MWERIYLEGGISLMPAELHAIYEGLQQVLMKDKVLYGFVVIDIQSLSFFPPTNNKQMKKDEMKIHLEKVKQTLHHELGNHKYHLFNNKHCIAVFISLSLSHSFPCPSPSLSLSFPHPLSLFLSFSAPPSFLSIFLSYSPFLSLLQKKICLNLYMYMVAWLTA